LKEGGDGVGRKKEKEKRGKLRRIRGVHELLFMKVIRNLPRG